jgi:hypothetical protein
VRRGDSVETVVPDVPLVELQVMLPQQSAELVLERTRAVVLLLSRDVVADVGKRSGWRGLPDLRRVK